MNRNRYWVPFMPAAGTSRFKMSSTAHGTSETFALRGNTSRYTAVESLEMDCGPLEKHKLTAVE
jgi:hypothetical protein